MLSKRYEPIEVDRRTWLHVPSGNHWSTSSDTQNATNQPKSTVDLGYMCPRGLTGQLAVTLTK